MIYLLVSAVCFSFAGIFVKGVEASGADVVFWRALFGAFFVLAWVAMTSQIERQIRPERRVFLIASIAVVGTTAFLMSFKHTSIANVAIIYATTPLVSGVLGWIILSERFSLKQIFFSLSALAGVGVVVYGSVGSINIYGDTLAIIMVATMALMIVLFRKYPETASGGVSFYSCAALAIGFSVIGDPVSVPIEEIGILALFALFFIVAYVSLQEGSKILPSALASLLSTLEMPLAPIWAYMILAEVPALTTVIGGVIILTVVLCAVLEPEKGT